jgi:late competence protein required for DNA uptake (superfamily II DNA/RNA helicase)
MTVSIVRRHGKELIRISTFPSRRIQRAIRRTRKRQLEILRHFHTKEVHLFE